VLARVVVARVANADARTIFSVADAPVCGPFETLDDLYELA
jgi:hypothetical protein